MSESTGHDWGWFFQNPCVKAQSVSSAKDVPSAKVAPSIPLAELVELLVWQPANGVASSSVKRMFLT
jgi:hypothetical protein